MSYTYITSTSGGDTGANCRPIVYVLRTQSGYSSDRSDAADGVAASLAGALNEGFIKGYIVYEYDISLSFDCSNALLPQLQTWRGNNGFTSDAVYLAVHRCDTNNPGVSDGNNAWSSPSDVHAKANRSSTAEFKNTASHEVMHSYVVHECDDINGMTTSSGHEHDLGTIIDPNGSEEYTPFGGSESVEHGTCSVANGGTIDNLTQELSTCTKQSLKYSANHTFNGHLEDAC